MMKSLRYLCVLAGLAAWHGAPAQAPAGTPAGANGMCNDGTYSMQASKDGACRGHKGVKTWYAAPVAKPAAGGSATKVAPAATAAPSVAPAAAAQAPAPAPAAKPAPAPMPAASAPPAPAPAAKASSGTKTPATAKVAAAGGGPGLVWVNTRSKVYHCYGGQDYGTTKEGAYMSEADAKAKGARADAGKACTQ